jgi:polysaccharide chain length determinant protein (PEP-CTERM system associated)
MHPIALREICEMNQTKTDMIKPEQVLEIISRRRWCILPLIGLSLIAGIYLAIALPKVYQAETLILVEGQRVPTEFVRSIVTTEIGSRISTISEQILSRTNLERIIHQFKLYSDANQDSAFLEDKVAALRKAITIDVSKGRRQANAFSIAFKAGEPQLAANIANALANAFIDENMRSREAQAIGTSDFLEAELNTMRARLEEQEQILMEFRKRHMGELPVQLDSNLRILDGLHKQLSDRQATLRAAKEQLAGVRNQMAMAPAGGANGNLASGDRAMSLPELRAELNRLEARYTEKHPDIIRHKNMIAELEKKAAAQSVAGGGSQASSASSQDVGQASDLNREIRYLEGDIANLQSQIRSYENRVETTPRREQELVAIQRDYDNIRESYQNLLNRKLEAEISLNMERKQKGEQFRVIDFARAPIRPVEPDMRKLFLVVMAAGFALAGGLVFLLEYLNTAFRAPAEMEKILGIPVLATIPVIADHRHRLLRLFNQGLTAISVVFCLLLLATFSTLIFFGIEPTINLFKTLV